MSTDLRILTWSENSIVDQKTNAVFFSQDSGSKANALSQWFESFIKHEDNICFLEVFLTALENSSHLHKNLDLTVAATTCMKTAINNKKFKILKSLALGEVEELIKSSGIEIKPLKRVMNHRAVNIGYSLHIDYFLSDKLSLQNKPKLTENTSEPKVITPKILKTCFDHLVSTYCKARSDLTPLDLNNRINLIEKELVHPFYTNYADAIPESVNLSRSYQGLEFFYLVNKYPYPSEQIHNLIRALKLIFDEFLEWHFNKKEIHALYAHMETIRNFLVLIRPLTEKKADI